MHEIVAAASTVVAHLIIRLAVKLCSRQQVQGVAMRRIRKELGFGRAVLIKGVGDHEHQCRTPTTYQDHLQDIAPWMGDDHTFAPDRDVLVDFVEDCPAMQYRIEYNSRHDGARGARMGSMRRVTR